MQVFSQKYSIVHFIEPLPDEYEFTMEHWPLHITLADVFAVNSQWQQVALDIASVLAKQPKVLTRVIGNDFFGESKSIEVQLLERTASLQQLHETIVHTLGRHNVAFNSPQYILGGFKPHATKQISGCLPDGEPVLIDSITLVDMFPSEDAFARKILATVPFDN